MLGPHLGNNLINLGIYEEVRGAVLELGLDFEALLAQEPEPGLGNGGLGRLAACFIDSLATLEIPTLAYGIRYEFGMFQQEIVDGWQVEKTDKWLTFGNPWEIARPEWGVEVKLGGHTEQYIDDLGRLRVRWVPSKLVNGVPYDTPILGFKNNTANTLRLWRAEAAESFDFAVFNRGDYYGAVNQKVISENLSKVLYPNDAETRGKELRLEQQYFFVSCSLQDMFRVLDVQHIPIERFHEKFTVQLNDTHPAIAVAELMRMLVDVHAMPWDKAWDITRRTMAYTNHTLLPEALECWTVALFGRVLPRHLEIIYEINARFLDEVRLHSLGDEQKVAALSLIDESGERYVRMAHLACVGSHAVNGVADLHTELLKRNVLCDFHNLWPQRFSNKTNGVTPRRWIVLANPQLTSLLNETIGDGWIRDLDKLRAIEPFVDDASFRERWSAIKRANKVDLAARIAEHAGSAGEPGFDVRRAGEAHPRVQAAAPEHPARDRAVPPAEERRRRRRGAAHVHFRRQGGARLSHREADDQAHQLRGRGAQSRPGDARRAARGVPAELQRDERPANLSGRRSLGADLDGGQGSFRHRQHEVLDERRAHHRHARRRERRAAYGGRRGQFLPVRPRRERGRGAAALGVSPVRLVSAQHGARHRRRLDSRRLLLARRPRALRAADARSHRLRSVLRVRGFCGVRRLPGRASATFIATASSGRGCRS